MSEIKSKFYKTLNNIVETNRIDNEESYIINNYLSSLENQLQQKDNIIKEAINCIKEESWFCYKDNEEVIDRTSVEKLLEILGDSNG